MKRSAVLVLLLAAASAHATPSTTVWAPSTTYIQPFLTPHLTYDTYFWKGTQAGQAGSPVYPVTTGLTMGVLPFDALQLEVGFDALLPSDNPFLFNAKLGVPEDKLFSFQPSLAVGVFGVGTKKSNSLSDLGTDYNVLYAQLQHTIPGIGGYVSVGGYYGAGSELLYNASDGSGVTRAGFIGGAMSPDINVNLPWLQKITFSADVQTGKNSLGAWGGALNFFFSDKISVLTGPVYFFDPGSQPGQRQWMWTMQLDIDMPLISTPAPQVTPTPAGASATPPAPAPAKPDAPAAVPASSTASSSQPKA